MNTIFSENELAVIMKYLRLSREEQNKFVSELISTEYEKMYSEGYRSSYILNTLSQKYNRSEAWLRSKIDVKSLNK